MYDNAACKHVLRYLRRTTTTLLGSADPCSLSACCMIIPSRSLLRYVEGSDGIELHFEGQEEPVKARLLVATVRIGMGRGAPASI